MLSVSPSASQLQARTMLPRTRFATGLTTSVSPRKETRLEKRMEGISQQYHSPGGWYKDPLSGFVQETPL